MARVIITGASTGAMACAARLAIKGHDVTIHEPSSTWAPDLEQISNNGFVFDIGTNFLTLPAVYRDLFLKTGASLEESLELIELDIAYRFQFGDGTVFRMPGAGIGRIAAALGKAFDTSADHQWRNFMSRAGSMWSVMRQPIIESNVRGVQSIRALPQTLRSIRQLELHRTLHSFATAYFTDLRLVQMAEYYATRTGADPRKTPATMATYSFIEQNFGVVHISGGMRKLASALFERCVHLGVKFEFDSAVSPFVTNSRVEGVRTSAGAVIPSDLVIADGTKADNNSEFILLLSLSGKTPGIEHHNVWFNNSSSTATQIYACVPDDATMSPYDGEAWCIRVSSMPSPVTCDRDGQTNHAGDALAEYVLEQLAGLGCDIRERILWQKCLTPTFKKSNTSPAMNGRLAAFRQESNVTKIDGLYNVGQDTHPGSSLAFVAIGANIVAQHIGSA